MKCTVNVLALPLVSLGWSSLSIRGNNNSGTWTLIWGIWEKKGPEIAAAWLATPSWSTFLPDAGRAPRGWKTTARASCLRRVVSALPSPSLTQMVAWTTSRTPGANQKLCPKYLLGSVFFFFFLTLSICLLIFTHLGVAWFHLGLETSKYLEGSSAKPLRERVSGVCLWIWGNLRDKFELQRGEARTDCVCQSSLLWAVLHSSGGNLDWGIKPKMLVFRTRQSLSYIFIFPKIPWDFQLKLKYMFWQPKFDDEPALALCCICLEIFWQWRLKTPSSNWVKCEISLRLCSLTPREVGVPATFRIPRNHRNVEPSVSGKLSLSFSLS